MMSLLKKLTLHSTATLLLLATMNPTTMVIAETKTEEETTVAETTVEVDESPLEDEDFKLIEDVYNSILDNYIEDVNKEVLLQGALDGMVRSLGDPYSEYLDSDESAQFDETIEGSFTGIGVQIMTQNGLVTIISPIADTPADKAGLRANDIILEADGVSLTDMNSNEVVKHIRGEIGTKVNLKIQRGSSTFEVEVERAEIPLISVESKLDENEPTIGYVQITQFASTTADEIEEAVSQLRKDGAKRFIFDLRNNPGGLLDQAIIISNMFLKDGDIIVQMQEQDKEPIAYAANDKAYGKFQIDEPYVVLINEGSASASEILSAAISENTDNPLVGMTTFGKGTAQNITNQSDFGELKLTVAKWLTPSGMWIHKTGITPKVEVENEPLANSISLNAKEEVKEGDASDYTKTAILILKALGYEINSDYLFEESVTQAVKAFQEKNNLEADGIITGDTANLLNNEAREYLNNHDVQYDKALETLLQVTE